MGDRGRGRSGGRGRSSGRAKSQDKSISGFQEQHSGLPPQAQGAWGRRPGPSGHSQQHGHQVPGSSHSTPYTKPQAPSRATQRAPSKTAPGHAGVSGPVPMDVVSADPAGGSGDATSLGRGAMRGGRVINVETLMTKPSTLATKQGVTGHPVRLQSNYFKLLTKTDWCLYQYRVDFAPDEDRTAVRKGMLKMHKETIGAYIFDGTVLYSSNRFPDGIELWSSRQSDDAKIRISIRLITDIVKGDYQYIQFFNIIIRKCLGLLNLQLVGRNYFDARNKVEIRQFRLELWPGYVTSIRQHEQDVLLCSEITHKVMRQETLLDILMECHDKYRQNFQAEYKRRVEGLVILTDYNNNTYRIDEVCFEVTPASKFQLKNNEQISYQEYYRSKYQINIRNPTQPMLLSRSKPRDIRAGKSESIFLVPELCRATGLTDEMRAQFPLMRAVSENTRVSPDARISKLMSFNRRLRTEENIQKELQQWNLKLDEKLVDLSGRVLPPENIVLGNRKVVQSGQFANWERELFNKPLFCPTRLTNWVVICTNRSRNDVQRFVRTLQDNARGMHCEIADPRYHDMRDDRANTYADMLEYIMSKSNPELVFCVVSNNRTDRYSAIKKKCLVDRPVPSQVFLERNLTNKAVRSIATKVAIQLTCKLGGSPWSVELPNINLMVIGFDVCHDKNKTGDFGAMVASLDKSLTRYFSSVSAHTTGEELSDELSVNITKAVQNYRQLNKTLPSHILIYRDGVGEGQIPYVYEHEVEQIKAKLKGVYGDGNMVKMAFIIVTKRINTRFFQGSNNPGPGTVIDNMVTDPMKYDFFVVSQSVRQGTVTPTAYNVIADTTGWKADQMQRMTYKLTHMYFNWSGTVRVPAPCQYAHKLAFLVSEYIHRVPSNQLETLLYYL